MLEIDAGKYSWKDGILIASMGIAVGITVIFFFLFLGNIMWEGIPHLSFSFLLEIPQNAGREGGILSIIFSTFLLLLVCMIFAMPLAIGTAIFLTEFTQHESAIGRLIRKSLDVLAGTPSIVFGLFGNALFCVYLKLGFSILSGGLTLACMVLPLLVRSTEEGIRSVSLEYRLAAAALGMSKTKTLFHIILPLAIPGMLAGMILGIGRAISETAALLFTSGYVDRMPNSLWDSGRSLSVHIYELSMNTPGGEANAYASSLILILLLIAITSVSNWVIKYWILQ